MAKVIPEFNPDDKFGKEMVTFYIRPDHKVLMTQAARRSPAGNLSAYLRTLICNDLRARGYIDGKDNPVREKPPTPTHILPLPPSPSSMQPPGVS